MPRPAAAGTEVFETRRKQRAARLKFKWIRQQLSGKGRAGRRRHDGAAVARRTSVAVTELPSGVDSLQASVAANGAAHPVSDNNLESPTSDRHELRTIGEAAELSVALATAGRRRVVTVATAGGEGASGGGGTTIARAGKSTPGGQRRAAAASGSDTIEQIQRRPLPGVLEERL